MRISLDVWIQDSGGDSSRVVIKLDSGITVYGDTVKEALGILASEGVVNRSEVPFPDEADWEDKSFPLSIADVIEVEEAMARRWSEPWE